jgi:hypothetical protein
MKNIVRCVLAIACIIALCTLLIACSDSRPSDDQPDQEASGAKPDTPSPVDNQPEPDDEPQVPSYPVHFEDEAFEKAIRKLIGKEEGEILSTDLSGITGIEIWGEEVVPDPSINVFGNAEGFTINGQRYTDRGNIQTLNDAKLFLFERVIREHIGKPDGKIMKTDLAG